MSTDNYSFERKNMMLQILCAPLALSVLELLIDVGKSVESILLSACVWHLESLGKLTLQFRQSLRDLFVYVASQSQLEYMRR